MTPATAAQTIGPYWHLIDDPALADLTRFGAAGTRLVLAGRLLDGDGAPVADACVELWQASPAADERFPGYGRCATGADGGFRFVTLKPGPVPGRGNTLQAPHLALNILARGILTRLYTRAYFAGEALNATDPLLALVEDPARRASLVASPDGPDGWRLDIRLQGPGESVFIEI
ncbi:MAG: protocatechuate 3,4-dioxygenase subunit alpha [Rhodospirillales bacterium 70-18]|nr:MAG: protocatechuate 3,4-dioxygenase subunit alpha [Rhodospirillales bacterium 70-18]